MSALDRAHRGERAVFERSLEVAIIDLIELAHLVIEFQLAQTLHGETALVLEAFEFKLEAGRTAPAPKSPAERRRDEERDRRDDQNRRQVIRHDSDPIAQLAFEPAPQFRIEVTATQISARGGSVKRGRRG